MKTITLDMIRSWKPCYDPVNHLSEEWSGTVIDLLKTECIPVQDRLWAALRLELVPERVLRLFAVWSARQVQHLMKDPRSIRALDVAEKYLNGEATLDELLEAKSAASDASASASASAYAADASASAYAAYTSAASAASASAYASAADASASAASAYAADASASAASAYAAYTSAASAASASAYAYASAARKSQINKLIELIEAENKNL